MRALLLAAASLALASAFVTHWDCWNTTTRYILDSPVSWLRL